MNTKRGVLILSALSLVAFLLLSSFVSAAILPASPLESFLDSLISAVKPIFVYTLGASDLDPSTFFVKILVFFLMLSMFYIAATRVPGISEHGVVIWLISIVMGILSARFLTTSALVNFVWLPTGIGGIALVSLLPFVLYFFFLESLDSHLIRKVGWVLFTVLYFGLAIVRWDTMSTGGEWWQNLAWMYIITGILSLILIFADRKIRMYMFRSSMRGITDKKKRIAAADVMMEIDKLYERLAKVGNDPTMRQTLESQIQTEEAKLKSILK
jgi:hypothetical protein